MGDIGGEERKERMRGKKGGEGTEMRRRGEEGEMKGEEGRVITGTRKRRDRANGCNQRKTMSSSLW